MVKIVVDSGCVNYEYMKDELGMNVEWVPLNLQLDDGQYVDDKSLNIEEYLQEMSKSKTVKTAAPSPELYLNTYKGEDSVFAITLSSKLSGSYNSAELAKQMYLSDIGNKFIHVFDSLGASVGEMLIAMKIHEFAKLNFSDLEIVEKVKEFMDDMQLCFILEKYDNLVKTGRVNPYIAKIATMLSIKPICQAVDGEISLITKARGVTKAIGKLTDIIASQIKDSENRVLGIMHVKDLDRALLFKEEILKKLKFKDVVIAEASGICATYAMESGLIVAY